MSLRHIRGAITGDETAPDETVAATRELLLAIVAANWLRLAELASPLFTTAPTLSSTYPARAAREVGWADVPLLGATEMGVPDGRARCIRVLVHVNTRRSAARIKHIYLRGARALRPDL